MKLLTIKFRLFLLLGIGCLSLFIGAKIAFAEMSPRDGFVRTTTGAPLPGVTVVEFTDWCPTPYQYNMMMPGCPAPTADQCHNERYTVTDESGHYYFPTMVPVQQPCDLNAWWRYTCSNPQVFYKILNGPPPQAQGFEIIPRVLASTDTGPGVCPPVQHRTDNVAQSITTDLTCNIKNACNQACTTPADCDGAHDGCTVCVPDNAGTGSTCQKPPACGTGCVRDDQCAAATRDGCTSCVPNNAGTGSVCSKPPACGSGCVRNDQCAGATKDGCTECRDGSCKKPPACGDSCTTKADCASAKDGCSDCLEGTCTDFKENMCKCDGIDSVIKYPSDKFDFTAYAKVMGADAAKAQVQSIQIFMAKNNDVIAKSAVMTPTVSETTAEKTRYKVSWSVPPPAQIDTKATYRVWADIKCKAKKRLPNPSPVAMVPTEVSGKGHGMFSQALDYITQALGVKNSIFKKAAIGISEVEAAAVPSPSVKENLQLETLQGVKIVETDSCRFVNFKFEESLFN